MFISFRCPGFALETFYLKWDVLKFMPFPSGDTISVTIFTSVFFRVCSYWMLSGEPITSKLIVEIRSIQIKQW